MMSNFLLTAGKGMVRWGNMSRQPNPIQALQTLEAQAGGLPGPLHSFTRLISNVSGNSIRIKLFLLWTVTRPCKIVLNCTSCLLRIQKTERNLNVFWGVLVTKAHSLDLDLVRSNLVFLILVHNSHRVPQWMSTQIRPVKKEA